MRALPAIITLAFLAGCTGAPSIDTTKVVDQKTNIVRQASKQQQSEFVGTSANASGATNAKPGWYKFGHP